MKTRTAIVALIVVAIIIVAAGYWYYSSYMIPEREQVIVVAVTSDPITLDPIATGGSFGDSVRMWVPMWDQLLNFDLTDPTYPVKPGLFTEWVLSDDSLTYTFKLRQGVKYHNDEPFNADAVVYTYNKVIDEDFGSPYKAIVEPVVENVEKIDDYTVAFHLTKPNPSFLKWMAQTRGFPIAVPPKYHEEVGAEGFNANPIGNGPFKFVEYIPGDRLVYERWDDYHGCPEWYGHEGLAEAKQLIFRIIPEPETRVAELETGGVDIIIPSAGVPLSVVPTLRADPNFEVEGVLFAMVQVMTNPLNPPFDDTRLRQAFFYCWSREVITDEIHQKTVTPWEDLLRADMEGYDPGFKAYELDLDKANELLDEAGWEMGQDGYRYKDGEKLSLLAIMPNYDIYRDPLIYIQDQCREVGIDLSIETIDPSAWFARISQGEHHVTCAGHGYMFSEDIVGRFHSRMSEEKPWEGFGYFIYHDSEVDAWVEELEVTVESARRVELIRNIIGKVALEDPVWKQVWVQPELSAYGAWLKEYYPLHDTQAGSYIYASAYIDFDLKDKATAAG